MSVLCVIQLVAGLMPTVKGILDSATSNESIVAKIKEVSVPLADVLDEAGAFLFPKVSPGLHVAAGAVAAFDPDVTKWVQGSLNVLLDPSPNLVVDGRYGPMTRNAVEQLQAKLGLKVDGWAGEITKAAIVAALAKLH